MQLKRLCVAGLLSAVCASTSVSAAQGEVCLAEAQISPAGVPRPFDDSTVFRCATAGEVTVAQLYSKGWRVVSVFPQASLDPTKPGMGSMVWTLVTEKI